MYISNLSTVMVLMQSDGPSWSVPTGRRDGRISSSSEASNLPSPADPVSTQREKFAAKGLTDHDLVTLVGTYFYPSFYMCGLNLSCQLIPKGQRIT